MLVRVKFSQYQQDVEIKYVQAFMGTLIQSRTKNIEIREEVGVESPGRKIMWATRTMQRRHRSKSILQ